MTTTAVTTKKMQETGVLVLSTKSSSNVPLVIKLNGGQIYKPNFKLRDSSETQIYGSCTVSWKNQNFMFGGANKMTQISKLEDCKVKYIGKLPFYHRFGTCATLNNELIYLCFSAHQTHAIKVCKVSKLPTGSYNDIATSSFDHAFTKIVNSKSESKYFLT